MPGNYNKGSCYFLYSPAIWKQCYLDCVIHCRNLHSYPFPGVKQMDATCLYLRHSAPVDPAYRYAAKRMIPQGAAALFSYFLEIVVVI